MQLTPEQAHAAHDLALYAVNTRELYPDAIAVMEAKACRPQPSTDLYRWITHTSKARARYEQELGRKRLFYSAKVMLAAAREIRDHYAEQQAEIAASMKGPDA